MLYFLLHHSWELKWQTTTVMLFLSFAQFFFRLSSFFSYLLSSLCQAFSDLLSIFLSPSPPVGIKAYATPPSSLLITKNGRTSTYVPFSRLEGQ